MFGKGREIKHCIFLEKDKIKATIVIEPDKSYWLGYNRFNLMNINELKDYNEKKYNITIENIDSQNGNLIIFGEFRNTLENLFKYFKLYDNQKDIISIYFNEYKDKLEELNYCKEGENLYLHFNYSVDYTFPVYNYLKEKFENLDIRGFDYEQFIMENCNKRFHSLIAIYY